MNLNNLLAQLALGEDSTRQFKADVKNADSLSAEIAALADTDGMALSDHVGPIRDLLSTEAAA